MSCFRLVSSRWMWVLLVSAVALTAVPVTCAFWPEWKSGIVWPEPKVVDPGPPGGPPSDAVVLFDGKDLSQWKGGDKWEIQDGYAISKKNGITTKESFGDCQLHVEFASPPEVKGSGQGRGNSGVFLMGRYEVQILDSYENTTYFDGQCGAIYKQSPPMVNACRKPGEWQTLDILFTAPRFGEDGKVTKPAFVTVLHNGVALHHHFEIQGDTAWHKPPAYEKHPEQGPIELQFHGNPVRFRNIWIRDLRPLTGVHPDTPEKDGPTKDAPTKNAAEKEGPAKADNGAPKGPRKTEKPVPEAAPNKETSPQP